MGAFFFVELTMVTWTIKLNLLRLERLVGLLVHQFLKVGIGQGPYTLKVANDTVSRDQTRRQIQIIANIRYCRKFLVQRPHRLSPDSEIEVVIDKKLVTIVCDRLNIALRNNKSGLPMLDLKRNSSCIVDDGRDALG